MTLIRNPPVRAFIAFELSLDVRKALGDLIGGLARVRRGVRWCEPGQTHITLKFFGDLPEATLHSVIDAVTPATVSARPIEVAIRGTGSFGPGDRIRVIWAGVEDPSGDLLRLQGALEEALEPLGFPREGRPFHPHLTLGRVRAPPRDPDLSEALKAKSRFDGGSFLADHLVLFSSTLTPGGPIYRALHTWPLEAER